MTYLILDACCGGRCFWFDKHQENTVYIDNRVANKGHIQKGFNPNHEVKPDILMNFTTMGFRDNTFRMVVWDPPHTLRLKETSILKKKYGCLQAETWQYNLKKGFDECWRVLKDSGVLIFKWSEPEIKLKKVLGLFSRAPLFGHSTFSKTKTHWLCFMKIDELEK